jgi:hypothetical protein
MLWELLRKYSEEGSGAELVMLIQITGHIICL